MKCQILYSWVNKIVRLEAVWMKNQILFLGKIRNIFQYVIRENKMVFHVNCLPSLT